MEPTNNLELFLLTFGDRLNEAAKDLFDRYDTCSNQVELTSIQVLREMILYTLPSTIDGIFEEQFNNAEFNFSEWWEAKRGKDLPGKVKKPERLIVRVLRWLLRYFSK